MIVLVEKKRGIVIKVKKYTPVVVGEKWRGIQSTPIAKINTSRKTVFRPVNSEQESWKVIEEIAAARRGREWHFEHTIVLVEKEQQK